MKIVTRYFSPTERPQTIEEFADRHDLVMVVTERGPGGRGGRFYACFQNCDIGGDGTLLGAFGDVDTPEEAIAAYGERISGACLVFDAFTDFRRQIQAPNFTTAENQTGGHVPKENEEK